MWKSFFFIFKKQAAAKKLASKAEREFGKPAVSEALARSGLDWLPADPNERGRLVRHLFAAVCGRSNYASLSVSEPPAGAMSSSLYDEECTPEDLSERRRLQAAAVLEVFQPIWALRSEGRSASHEDVDNSPPTLQQCEQLLAAWQPTAKSPSVNASNRVDWTEGSALLDELIEAKRSGRPISGSPEKQQRLLASVDMSQEPGAAAFRSELGALATQLANDAASDPSSADLGSRLIEQMSSKDDPYACIQVAQLLWNGDLVKRDLRRALSLAEKAIGPSAPALQLPQSRADALRIIGSICAFEPDHCDPHKALAKFKEGAELGDYWCAYHAAQMLGSKEYEEVRKRYALKPGPELALLYLNQANDRFELLRHDLSPDEQREVKDRHRRLLDEIEGIDDPAAGTKGEA